MSSTIALTPIAVVHSPIREPLDDVWGGFTSRIELDPARFTSDALLGLSDYSHVEVVFFFHRIPEAEIFFGARHPRGRTDVPKVGVFAQRAKHRPNRIGITVCRLVSVKGLTVEVEGLDAIDGTPVIDIKPYLEEFGPKGPVHQPPWTKAVLANYWNPPR